MKVRNLSAMLAIVVATSIQLLAQDTYTSVPPAHHYAQYRAMDLGTLGGPNSSGCVPGCRLVTNAGAVVFLADTSAADPFPSWLFGDGYQLLGVYLQPGNSAILAPPDGAGSSYSLWAADSGLVAGLGENGLTDPNTGAPQLTAILWRKGKPLALGTLGGNGSVANSVNNHGQVVGGALTSTSDPFNFYYFTDFFFPVTTEVHAFLWEQEGMMRDLGTLGTGTDSYAAYVNEAGQVTGWSFTDTATNPTTGIPTLDPFFWENRHMTDLGTLGGTFGYTTGINNAGHVIGVSDVSGDVNYHPFVWTKGKGLKDLGTLGGSNGGPVWINDGGDIAGWANTNAMMAGNPVFHAVFWKNDKPIDLGTVAGDGCSGAFGLNAKGQVVGDSGTCIMTGFGRPGLVHPFLWQQGLPMVDLSTLFAPFPSGLTMLGACCINDQGEILGSGKLPNGDTHAILLVPCEPHPTPENSCAAIEPRYLKK